MANFLELVIEGITLSNKRQKAKLLPPHKKHFKHFNLNAISTRNKPKRVIPRKLSLLNNKKLMRDTNKTRIVWDPKGYAGQRYLDKVYKKL